MFPSEDLIVTFTAWDILSSSAGKSVRRASFWLP
jgi:hypothetical protein